MLSTKPISASIGEEYCIVEIDGPSGISDIKCKLICGADGAHSWVRREFRMGKPTETIIGFQIEVTGYQNREGTLDMYTGKSVSPDSSLGPFPLVRLQELVLGQNRNLWTEFQAKSF